VNSHSAKIILVVDDDPAVLRFLLALFRDEGYQTWQAGDGQAALALLNGARPDLVLSDINMPLLDGIQLCRALKAAPEYNTIPFVLMSVDRVALGRSDIAPDAVVVKPLNIDQLLTVVEDLLAEG